MKTKCYRFDNQQEFDALVEKYGDALYYIPRRRGKDQSSGFLYDKASYSGNIAGWTSATIEKFNTEKIYKNCQMIPFSEAIKNKENKMKIGQKVKCINDKDSTSLVYGITYEVSDINQYGNIQVKQRNNNPLQHYYKPTRFELVADSVVKIDITKGYKTKDGRKVKLLAISDDRLDPIIGQVLEDGEWFNYSWKMDGSYYSDGESDSDLVEQKNQESFDIGSLSVICYNDGSIYMKENYSKKSLAFDKTEFQELMRVYEKFNS